ncbi:MAG TPA: alpha/beta fold hydrolase [Streptosporangiaceae bacterium]|nr:alpha/beta fold hydrolase [Streptosporangiaceae bacterium]
MRDRKGARSVRFLLGLADRYAPGLGARLGVRLWLTIPPAARRSAGATSAGSTSASGTPTTAATTGAGPGAREVLDSGVVTETWGDGPPVYLLHGWAGYRAQFAAFVEPLVRAGFRVIAIDAPGHGESGPGRHGRGRADMVDFIGALRSAATRYGQPHAVIGHSFGASAVAVAALDGLRAERLVLIAPVSNVASGLDFFARISGLGSRTLSRMVPRMERVVGRPVADFDIALRSAEREELPPALVIHDTQDKEVPFGNGALVGGAWPGGRLVPTEGLGHKRILRDAGLVSTVIGFVAGKQYAVMNTKS